MPKCLLTEKKAQVRVSKMPTTGTATSVTPITIGVTRAAASTSQRSRAAMPAYNTPSASYEESNPIQKACNRKGRRMKLQRAPTNFIV